MADKHSAATRLGVPLLLAVVAGLLLAIAGEGPDFGHYAAWAGAALTGDIFTLPGNVLSPAGVPFSLAAAGPGLLFAVGKAALFPLTFGAASLVTGWVAAIVFWTAAFVVLRRVTGDRNVVALFGAGALFVGTHAGIYSHAYATEVFANALIATLWAYALTRDRWRVVDSATVGALAGLLLLVRAHVVLYAVPAIWLAAFGPDWPFARPAGVEPLSDRSPERDTRPRVAVASMAGRVLAVAAPMAVALAEYATVNRWMTGSLSHPPYLYGGAGFTSVDLWHPLVGTVLWHPWRGLLSYHPLYGVAIVAVAVQAWRDVKWRRLWVATLLAAVAHVWVQAGWYIWWLGGTPVGMRGMAPAALPVVAGLVAAIARDLDTNPRRARTWTLAVALACMWSFPLLMAGHSDAMTWAALLDAQRPALAAMTALLLVAGYRHLSRRSATRADVEHECRWLAALLGGAIVAYLGWRFVSGAGQPMRGMSALVAGAVVFACGCAGFLALPAPRLHRRIGMPQVLAAAVLALFIAQALLFGRLAIRTERHLASGAPPPRPFEYRGASPVDELRMNYREYLTIPGFEDQKAAFRRYLAWQRVDASRLSPADHQIAEAVRARLAGDRVMDDVLLEITAHDGVLRIAGDGMNDAQESRVRAVAAAVPGAVGVVFAPD